jgi:hypothetical protein
MQGLPVFLEAGYKACQASLAYQSLLAVRNLGNQYCGSLAQGVHKLDGSYASSEHHTGCSNQIPVENHL